MAQVLSIASRVFVSAQGGRAMDPARFDQAWWNSKMTLVVVLTDFRAVGEYRNLVACFEGDLIRARRGHANQDAPGQLMVRLMSFSIRSPQNAPNVCPQRFWVEPDF